MRYLIKDFGFTRLIDVEEERLPRLNYYSHRCYHCPQCGTLWAIWEIETDPREPSPEYVPIRRSCGEHSLGQWTGDVPGSQILYPTDILVLPRPLLERELFLRTGGIPL